MNESYTGFARVYDRFMDDVPYDEWAHFLVSLLKKYGSRKGMETTGTDAAKTESAEMDSVRKPEAVSGLETERNIVLDLGCGTGTLTDAGNCHGKKRKIREEYTVSAAGYEGV